jgi:hypothetical protein
MTARVEGGREEMVDAKADSSGMSWTVAMVVGCVQGASWRWTDVGWDGRVARARVRFEDQAILDRLIFWVVLSECRDVIFCPNCPAEERTPPRNWEAPDHQFHRIAGTGKKVRDGDPRYFTPTQHIAMLKVAYVSVFIGSNKQHDSN